MPPPFLGAGTPAAGPNGKIGIGFIGAGKRAFELLPAFLDHADCRVVAERRALACGRELAVGRFALRTTAEVTALARISEAGDLA